MALRLLRMAYGMWLMAGGTACNAAPTFWPYAISHMPYAVSHPSFSWKRLALSQTMAVLKHRSSSASGHKTLMPTPFR